MKKTVDFFLFTNIFVAISVVSLVFETQLILYHSICDFKFPIFLFFSTLFLYNFHRIFHLKIIVKKSTLASRHQWLQENKKKFYGVLFFALFGEIYSLIYCINLNTFLWLIPVGIISFGYTVPFIKTSNGWIRLRDIRGLKIFLITFVLGLVTVFLPVIFYTNLSAFLHPEIQFVFFRRMLFIFAITIPFDIRDVDYDTQNNIKTLPILFGISTAKKMSYFALIVFTGLAILQYFIFPKTSLFYLAALCISVIPTSISIFKTEKNRSDFFFSFGLEGMMILQCILVILAYKFAK
ncbi:MAG TPA: UbiA family prenyltransferase [Bacteroidia bacterium]|nr:UbiA family prenyltransferase [Bacteroidia bacterium]